LALIRGGVHCEQVVDAAVANGRRGAGETVGNVRQTSRAFVRRVYVERIVDTDRADSRGNAVYAIKAQSRTRLT
jgi:hypothetical protein